LNVFFDSSALAKRYVEEAASNRVQDILLSANSLTISVLCISEIISALCRRRRERKLSQQQYLAAKEALFADIEDMNVVNLTDQVIARSVSILEKWPLRSSDSLHVASAAEWASQLFVSADERQCAAARKYGLQVEQLPTG
jgi:uncharacterized protein